jgi:hypothetical protein
VQSTNKIPDLVRRLHAITQELSRLFPGRPFTLDGHLVGSIGEVIAAYRYGLSLLPPSSSTHDARAPDGRLVQVKATQGKSVALRENPDFLIVVRLHSNGTSEDIYNGPGKPVWDSCGRMQKNGQRPISLAKLRQLNQSVRESTRIPRTYP